MAAGMSDSGVLLQKLAVAFQALLEKVEILVTQNANLQRQIDSYQSQVSKSPFGSSPMHG